VAKRKPVPKGATLFDGKKPPKKKPSSRKNADPRAGADPKAYPHPRRVGPFPNGKIHGPFPKAYEHSSRVGPTPAGPEMGPAAEGSPGFAGMRLEQQRRLMKAANEERDVQYAKKLEELAKKRGLKYKKGMKPREAFGSLRRQAVTRNVLRAGGVAALGLLGGMAAKRAAYKAAGVDETELLRKAIYDLEQSEREGRMNRLTQEAQAASYEDSIQRNLMNLQNQAPDLYASVAAGRRLPQGGIVIGGSPRQDLLNELGRAMADGRFSR